jgi:tetratricopeptide (TPR) repeat protein
MDQSTNGYHDLGSLAYLREQLILFRACGDDHRSLAKSQDLLQKVISRSLNTDAAFHEGVATLLAVAPFIYRHDNQAVWQRLTWDALIGALNLKDGALQAQIMNVMSRFHMLEGKHQLARKNIETALARAREENNELALLWAYIRFFELLVYQPADFSRQEVVKKVLALAEKVHHPRTSTALHSALAHFYNRWGDYERALGHGQMAYALARQQRSNQEMIKAAYLLVGICRMSACPAAQHFLKVADAIDETRLSLIDQINVIAQHSALHYEMGLFQAAADGYQDAINLLEHLNRPMHLAASLQGLALAQIRLLRFEQAQNHLEQAEELWNQCGSAYEHAHLRFTQSLMEALRGNKRLALSLIDDALRYTDDMPDMASREQIRASIRIFKRRVETGQRLEDDLHLA